MVGISDGDGGEWTLALTLSSIPKMSLGMAYNLSEPDDR